MEDQITKPTAILLAGGMSRRFGKANKLLAQKNGQTLIQHSLKNIASSRITQLLIVLGHDSHAIEQHCRDCFKSNTSYENVSFDFVFNADFTSGMASSLKAGISELIHLTNEASPSKAPAAMVFLADMPSIKATTINTLIGALESENHKLRTSPSLTKTSAIIPTHNKSRGNPVILMPELFNALLKGSGDIGAKQLLNANPDVVLEVNVDDSGILSDYDTPDQLHDYA